MTHPAEAPSRNARVFAIANQKGGVGKTTTAINLGTALVAEGLRSLIIDLDPQGNASTGLGSNAADRAATSYQALSGAVELESSISETSVPNLDIVPASVDLSGIDVEFVGDPQRAKRLRGLLEAAREIREHYDYILIDCPPSLNLLTINALVAADAVIVPLQCEFFALEGLAQLLATVRRVQGGLNPRLRIHGIVLTMFDIRNRLSSQVAQDVRENLGAIVYSTMIPRNVRLSEAPSHALPVLLYDPACAGSQAYRALAAELLGRDGRPVAA
jgi:chromosome partitioning protein